MLKVKTSKQHILHDFLNNRSDRNQDDCALTCVMRYEYAQFKMWFYHYYHYHILDPLQKFHSYNSLYRRPTENDLHVITLKHKLKQNKTKMTKTKQKTKTITKQKRK